MKRSSFLIVALLLGGFLTFQGWLMLRTFWWPEEVQAVHAVLLRETITIGTPVAGIVRSVDVEPNQVVDEDDILFSVIPQSPEQPSGGRPFIVRAPRAGVIGEVHTLPGDFVQASQRLARLVDTDPDASYVEAHFPLAADDWSRIRNVDSATVVLRAFGEKDALEARVASVSPHYDFEKKLVSARLKIMHPERIARQEELPSGVPAEAMVYVENGSTMRRWIVASMPYLFPSSFAKTR